MENEKLILETVLDTNTRVARIEEQALNLDTRLTVVERRWWQVVGAVIIGLTSLLASGAAAFVNFFQSK